MARFTCRLVLLLLIMGAIALDSAAEARAAVKRLPEPSAAQTADAEKLVRDTFKTEYAKSAAADRRAFAKKLLEQARQDDATDPAERFVLLREARDVAADAGDAETAMASIDDLARGFILKGEPEMRIAAAIKCAPKAATPELRHAVAIAATRALESCLASDDFSGVNKLSPLLSMPAYRAPDMTTAAADLKAQLAEAKKMAGEFAKVRPALDKLLLDNADATSNFVVGRYECLFKGDWELGLPRLAKGSDPTLAALAKQESAAADAKELVAADQKKVGDGWWDYSTKLTGRSRSLGRAHAAAWYADAQKTGLTGLSAVAVKKRLDEARADTSVASANGKEHRPINLIAAFDPNRDIIHGKWSVKGGILDCAETNFVPHVEFPYEPPAEYDMKIEWSQPALRNPVSMILSKGESSLVFCTGKDGLGFIWVDDKGTKGFDRNNPSYVSAPGLLQANKRYIAIVKVRNRGLEAFLNGKRVTSLETNYPHLKVESWYALKHPSRIGISCDDPTDFYTVELTEITGTATRIEGDKPAEKRENRVGAALPEK